MLMPTYTLFRHKRRPELRCAIPAHHTLPNTLEAEVWEQDPTAFDEAAVPPGFDESAARYAIAVQGFYIFGRRTRVQTAAQQTAAA